MGATTIGLISADLTALDVTPPFVAAAVAEAGSVHLELAVRQAAQEPLPRPHRRDIKRRNPVCQAALVGGQTRASAETAVDRSTSTSLPEMRKATAGSARVAGPLVTVPSAEKRLP